MIRWLARTLTLAALLPIPAAGAPQEPLQYLKAHGRPPVDYVLAKARAHRVVLLGESHWIRHDVELVIDLVPRLRDAGVDVLALEMLPAGEQATIDRILAADTWEESAAIGILRVDAWPYREYLEILHAAWKTNQRLPSGAAPLRVIALGPGSDWRERLLPRGEDYDQFMARLVRENLKSPGRRALVYVGLHHAFARFHQPELPRGERVERYMDRMGNILWRELGDEVFSILLASSWQCRAGPGGAWGRCLPAQGAVDCAAAPLGHPVGFDIAASPFAEQPIGPDTLYSPGYPSLRLVDMVDGYVWNRPIDEFQGVHLIPLSEFAPDAESLAEVARNNPLSDEKGLGRAELQALWDREAERLRDLPRSSSWQSLLGWRKACSD